MDAFNLTARLRLDTSEYDEALGRVRENLPRLGDESEETGQRGEQSAHRMGAAFKTVAVAVGAAVSAAAAGAGALVKQSVDAYANYEQLVGGVETLFSNLEGTVSAAPTVLENASNAYKTAGMSANEYMETVTSFSAALVSSLGNDYQKAAEISDMAIRDMSDNANKMGTSMEAIQNAYQGFSKQNYTMLDNLKLGYGGTKTEMERLVADAEKLNSSFRAQRDENGKLTLSLDDVYNAIHIVQQEMGIAGTTAKEAGDTISGSFGSLSAAWENLVTGFADKSADLPALIDNVVTAAEGSFKNLMPVAEQAISGLANFVEDIAPVITEKIPGLVDEILPPLLSTANTVVNSLVTSLPPILSGIVEVVPSVVTDITDTFIQELPQIVDLGADLVVSLANGITDALPELIPAATNAITEIAQTLTDPDRLSELLEAGVNMIGAILEGVVQAVPQLVNAAIDAAGNLLSALPGLQGFGEFLKEHKELVEAAAAAWVVFKAATAIGNVISAATTAIGALRDGLAKLIVNLVAETDATAASTAAHLAHAAAIAGVAVAAAAVGAELVYYAKNIFDVSDGVKNLQKAQEDFNATLAAGHTSVDAELDQLQRKADKYEELRKIENRTEEQERQLKLLANELQTALGGEVQVVNSATGEYNDLTKSVNDYIEAKKREAMISVYQDKIKQAYEEMFKVEEEMARRQEQHANRGFNFLDWNGAMETNSFINDMNALRETKAKWEKTIDDITGDMESKLDEAKKDIDNSFNDLGDSMYAAEQRLASYAPAKFIPTEALRQQQGGAAPTFTLLPSLTKPIEDAANEGSRLITAASNAASSTTKKTLTFATKAIGEYKDLGVVKELGKALSETEEEADKIASTVWSKSQEVFNRSITNNQLSLADQVKGWEIIRDQFVVNSDQWIAANDKVIASQRKLEEENQKTAENMSTSIADAYKTMQENVASLQNEYQQALSDRADEIMNQFGLFDEVPQSVQISGEQLMKNLNEQVNATRKFYSDIEKLSERGVSDELVESIRSMGVKAGNELDALLNMTDEKLAEYDSKFTEKKELSTGFAEEQLEPLKEETQKKIDEEIKNYGTQVAALAVDYGVEFMTGMSEGIKTGAETVVADAKDAVNTAWKEAFGTTDMTSIGTIAPELTSNATVNNDNKFTFNINGIQYQTITQLAKAVANEMQFLTNRRKAGYAGT